MELDYQEIGGRIMRRRKEQKLSQAEVAEKIGITNQYISNIERAISIPSTEVIMRLAIALDTTPDEFLVGTVRHEDETWKNVAERLRGLNPKQLTLAESFLSWLREQDI